MPKVVDRDPLVGRKGGLLAPLRELIEPYEPNDYRAIVSGEWRQESA